MMHRLLLSLAHQVLNAPVRTIVLAVVPTILFGAASLTVPKDISFTGVMDRENVEVARYFDVSKQLALGGALPLLVEGPEEKLDAALAALRPALEALASVRVVYTEVPVAWLNDNAVFLVETPTFERWVKLATSPDDAENVRLLEADLTALQEEAKSLRPEGYRVVQVIMREDPFDLEAGGKDLSTIEAVTKDVLGRFGATGEYTGLAAISGQDQARTLGRISLLSPLSLLLVLFLFRFLESSLIRIFLVAIPMLLSVVATLGIAGLITGTITLVESFFGVMIFGLGIDFALHLMIRLREERARGQTFEEAMTTTLTGAGRGIVAGAITTASAFGIVALAPDPMALHLGLSGAVGIIVCLFLMLTVLPSLWVILERRGTRLVGRTDEVKLAPVTYLASVGHRHPFPVIGLSLVVLAVCIMGMPRFHFETNLEKVFNRQVPAITTATKMQELFGVNAGPWFTSTKTLDENRTLSKKLIDTGLFSRVEGLGVFFAEDPGARQQRLNAAAEEIRAQKATFEGLLPIVTDDEKTKLTLAIELLDRLVRASTVKAPTLDDVPPVLSERLRGPGGEFIIFAYVKTPSLDGHQARESRLAIQAVAPEATGGGALLEAIMVADRPWAVPIFFGILLLVLAILLIDIRVPKLVILSIVPVVLATTVTFGVLCWSGVSFNVLTTLVIPLIIGLGVDNGIHVVHRIKEDKTVNPDIAAASVGKAIVMTTVTTCSSFGTLLFTDHAGMEGMALVILIGLPTSLIASVTTIPAMARALGVNRGSVSAPSTET